MKYFINEDHEANFVKLLKRDKTFKGDFYRLPFFYLLSTDLTINYIDDIYNFEEGNLVDVNIADKRAYSSSARELINLAINLFSNYRFENQSSVVDIFSAFDEERHLVAIYGIDMRMRSETYKQLVDEFYEKHNLNHTPIRYY